MWFIKLCLFVITVNMCRMIGQNAESWIIIFSYCLEEFFPKIFKGGKND